MSKETPRQQGQPLCPEMKVLCPAKKSSFTLLAPFISPLPKKGMVELFETKFIFFYSMLCLCPCYFSVAVSKHYSIQGYL